MGHGPGQLLPYRGGGAPACSGLWAPCSLFMAPGSGTASVPPGRWLGLACPSSPTGGGCGAVEGWLSFTGCQADFTLLEEATLLGCEQGLPPAPPVTPCLPAPCTLPQAADLYGLHPWAPGPLGLLLGHWGAGAVGQSGEECSRGVDPPGPLLLGSPQCHRLVAGQLRLARSAHRVEPHRGRGRALTLKEEEFLSSQVSAGKEFIGESVRERQLPAGSRAQGS